MNFGILCVQGIVNSFGTNVMAAFAVTVKIDTIAYMPVQDFGNAFSVFVTQKMSVALTVISLGTRVLLSYVLSVIPVIGVVGIWAAIPIGWFQADAVGISLNLIN